MSDEQGLGMIDHGEQETKLGPMQVFELTGGPIPSEFEAKDKTAAAEAALGHGGKMISASKSGYGDRHPFNLAIFNANVCVQSEGKIWYGDLDLSLAETLAALERLAVKLQETVYVLWESDARFYNEVDPRYERAALAISANGAFDWTEQDFETYYDLVDGLPRLKVEYVR